MTGIISAIIAGAVTLIGVLIANGKKPGGDRHQSWKNWTREVRGA